MYGGCQCNSRMMFHIVQFRSGTTFSRSSIIGVRVRFLYWYTIGILVLRLSEHLWFWCISVVVVAVGVADTACCVYFVLFLSVYFLNRIRLDEHFFFFLFFCFVFGCLYIELSFFSSLCAVHFRVSFIFRILIVVSYIVCAIEVQRKFFSKTI